MPLKGSLEAFPLLSSAEFRVCTKPEGAWELPGGVDEQCQGWDTSTEQEGIPGLDTERATGVRNRKVRVSSQRVCDGLTSPSQKTIHSPVSSAPESEALREDTVPGSWTVICPTGRDGLGLALNKGLIRNSCSLQRRLQKHTRNGRARLHGDPATRWGLMWPKVTTGPSLETATDGPAD